MPPLRVGRMPPSVHHTQGLMPSRAKMCVAHAKRHAKTPSTMRCSYTRVPAIHALHAGLMPPICKDECHHRGRTRATVRAPRMPPYMQRATVHAPHTQDTGAHATAHAKAKCRRSVQTCHRVRAVPCTIVPPSMHRACHHSCITWPPFVHHVRPHLPCGTRRRTHVAAHARTSATMRGMTNATAHVTVRAVGQGAGRMPLCMQRRSATTVQERMHTPCTTVPPFVHRTCKAQRRMPLRVQGQLPPCVQDKCRCACRQCHRTCKGVSPRVQGECHSPCRASAAARTGRVSLRIQGRVSLRIRGEWRRAFRRVPPCMPPFVHRRMAHAKRRAHAIAHAKMSATTRATRVTRMSPCTARATICVPPTASCTTLPPSYRACHAPRMPSSVHACATVRNACHLPMPPSVHRSCKARGACHYEFRAHATAHARRAIAHAVVHHACRKSRAPRMRDPCTACATVRAAHASAGRMPLRVQIACHRACKRRVPPRMHGPCTLCHRHARACHHLSTACAIVKERACHRPCTAHAKRRAHATTEFRARATAHARSVHRACHRRVAHAIIRAPRVPPLRNARATVHAPLMQSAGRMPLQVQGACHRACKGVCHRACAMHAPSCHRPSRRMRIRAPHAKRRAHATTSSGPRATAHAKRVPPRMRFVHRVCHRLSCACLHPCTACVTVKAARATVRAPHMQSAGRMPLRVQGACHRACGSCRRAIVVRPRMPSFMPRVPPSENRRATVRAPLMQARGACHYEFRAHATAHTKTCATAHAWSVHHACHRLSLRMRDPCTSCATVEAACATVMHRTCKARAMPLRVQDMCHRACTIRAPCAPSSCVTHAIKCTRVPPSARATVRAPCVPSSARACHHPCAACATVRNRACHRPCTAHASAGRMPLEFRAHATAHTKACATRMRSVHHTCHACARMRIRAPRVPLYTAHAKRRAHATTSSGRVPPRMHDPCLVRHRRASRMPSSAPRVPPSGTAHATVRAPHMQNTGRMPLRVQGACHRPYKGVCHRACTVRATCVPSCARMRDPCTACAAVRGTRVPSCTAHAKRRAHAATSSGRVPSRMRSVPSCHRRVAHTIIRAACATAEERACHRPCTAHARRGAHATTEFRAHATAHAKRVPPRAAMHAPRM
ncbi:hypothetical protein AAG906_020759 [Vitis piasezkii]